jgi:hypothetical protein
MASEATSSSSGPSKKCDVPPEYGVCDNIHNFAQNFQIMKALFILQRLKENQKVDMILWLENLRKCLKCSKAKNKVKMLLR